MQEPDNKKADAQRICLFVTMNQPRLASCGTVTAILGARAVTAMIVVAFMTWLDWAAVSIGPGGVVLTRAVRRRTSGAIGGRGRMVAVVVLLAEAGTIALMITACPGLGLRSAMEMMAIHFRTAVRAMELRMPIA